MIRILSIAFLIFIIFYSNNSFAINNNNLITIEESKLIYYLNNPKFAKAYRFDLKDTASTPNAMHAVSIIQLTGQKYKYAAVYHTRYDGEGGRFKVNLAASNDLMNWAYIGVLADNASMPKIAMVTGSTWIVVTHEQWVGPGPGSAGPSHLAFDLFYNFDDLMNRTIRSRYIMPEFNPTSTVCIPTNARKGCRVDSVATALNGTPSIYEFHLAWRNGWYSVDGQYGFHYWDGTRDSNAVTTIIGMFDPTRKTTAYPSAAGAYNRLIMSKGVTGNIGDRDTLLTSAARYNLQEGNLGLPADTFNKWQVYLYRFAEPFNYPTGSGVLTPLYPKTPNSSTSFGNPRITVVDRPDGTGKALLVSYFIFSEGAGPGEAGSLLYYYDI